MHQIWLARTISKQLNLPNTFYITELYSLRVFCPNFVCRTKRGIGYTKMNAKSNLYDYINFSTNVNLHLYVYIVFYDLSVIKSPNWHGHNQSSPTSRLEKNRKKTTLESFDSKFWKSKYFHPIGSDPFPPSYFRIAHYMNKIVVCGREFFNVIGKPARAILSFFELTAIKADIWIRIVGCAFLSQRYVSIRRFFWIKIFSFFT